MGPDRNKLQKYFADLSRVCDLEDTICEWFGKDYYEKVSTEALQSHIRHQIDDLITKLELQFKIEHIDVGGIDFSVWKICCKALLNPKTLETVTY